MNTEQLTKLASFAGKSANDFWMSTGKKPTDVIAVLASALIEANGRVQALTAENVAHKSAFKTILEHCPVNHPDIDKAVVAMIAYDEAFNRESRDNSAAVAQMEARVRDEVIDWFETEIMAIDPVYRGSPSYTHDGYDIKHKALELVDEAKTAFSAVLREGK